MGTRGPRPFTMAESRRNEVKQSDFRGAWFGQRAARVAGLRVLREGSPNHDAPNGGNTLQTGCFP